MKEHDIDPGETTILSFGSSEFNQYLSHPFICIDQPTFDLGYRAFKRLVMEIESNGEAKPELISMQTNVIK
jgi:DNA-binding LacI/PurR family transcriptional regulator